MAWWTGPEQSSAFTADSHAASSVRSSGPPAFVVLLQNVHGDLRAYLFLFVGVACVGNAAAASSASRCCVWEDDDFWRSYGGPCLLHIVGTTASLRDTFRKWLFHLDGAWAQDFQEFVDRGKQKAFGADFRQLFADALYLVSGLTPSDDPRAVRDFSRTLTTLLAEYNPLQLDERDAAERLIRRVRRCNIFTEDEVGNICSSHDQTIEQVPLDMYLEDIGFEPFNSDYLSSLELAESWN
mmetsp:Transcript_29074/g.76731  ORF Transcript_29074/g.76731 Transcript_29074/m.76731 type:complete len:239 (-) Transcript_29074:143-859(-)|eukprot:CAMPEP_0194528380 /NCGR_PEP_ID=MMETSP0253-20130528/64756_1 /TAXON_ID=2966 /ORGANISM="Noctiluca scintillans" /LENGTH=238 /DNA_ID=CAMNT_0039373425 /DNA_START=42 /DNA_END=761 /DNA_ORIENTATION=+